MSDFKIPPEVVEAALAEILRQNEHLPRSIVEAALRAALAAWTRMEYMMGDEAFDFHHLILPMPQETSDE